MKQQSYKITFHLGMPKTGTTFLQREVFPHFEQLRYFKKHDYELHKETLPTTEDQNYFFSCEFDNWLERELKDISSIHAEFGVIYFLRKHEKWITSKYKYYIRKHGYKKFNDYVNLDDADAELDLIELDFRRKIDLIKQYSPDKYMIIDFEDLKKRPLQVIERICEFSGGKIDPNNIKLQKRNEAFSVKQLLVLLRFNAFYKYTESTSSSKFVRRFHYKYREFLLHIVAFFAKLTPKKSPDQTVIIDTETLERIRLKYKEDWDYCLEHMEVFEA